jgi:hypothetical protein
MLSCAKLFFSGTLDTLSLCLPVTDKIHDIARFSVLGSLPLLCPALSSLELYGCTADLSQTAKATKYLSTTLSGLQTLTRLQSLTLRSFPESVWCNIASFSGLRYLIIQSSSSNNFKPPAQKTTGNYFPCLEGLELKTRSVKFGLWMIENMGQPPLKTITLEFEAGPALDEWNRFLVTLQPGLIHRHLQEISVTVLPQSCVALTMEQFRPLLDFTNLKSVRFRRFNITLDDHDITKIAFAYPYLESLDLHHILQSTVTFEGLAALAPCCRALKTSRLNFDASKVLQDDLDVDNIPRNEALTTLDVQSSPINNPTLVAALLSAIFPNLQIIHHTTQFMQKWTQVMELIKIFTAVRRQEISMYKRNYPGCT